MKKVIVSFCFIISMVMCGGIVAQNNNAKVEKSKDNPSSISDPDSIKNQKWINQFERFVGVWSLERTIVDANGDELKDYPGTFMVVHPNSSYVIFVNTDVGAVITSEGVILVEASDQYLEVISQHMNKYLIGLSNRIEYKLTPTYLHKSFWIEKDRQGGEYKRQVNETWKRATMAVGEYENNPAFPI
ncbi:MAG: DUF4488 domain-containing protein [Candidatus Saccharimonadaceae bacterium]